VIFGILSLLTFMNLHKTHTVNKAPDAEDR
jgi:hypothetical protein